MTYTYYRHISGKDGLQLVLPTGADFPKEATAADWIQTAVKDGKDAPQIDKDEVAKKGYRLTKVKVTFTEGIGNPPADSK
ncbi:hypothetical protein [Mesorhizobium sp. WSM3862]|uniref:hypothetical protein n=1 Tax=Mesorhizobium sp. WSM3862 TaxID=632858 RepID=UPI000BAF110E|nr:hypothetical protein [Mesorhizobium sp. WSM3862]PBB97611.1 hypothetical protein CK224_12980 [Mesorhizobium sp. WSM3862]